MVLNMESQESKNSFNLNKMARIQLAIFTCKKTCLF